MGAVVGAALGWWLAVGGFSVNWPVGSRVGRWSVGGGLGVWSLGETVLGAGVVGPGDGSVMTTESPPVGLPAMCVAHPPSAIAPHAATTAIPHRVRVIVLIVVSLPARIECSIRLSPSVASTPAERRCHCV
jgi:hypothetical protein